MGQSHPILQYYELGGKLVLHSNFFVRFTSSFTFNTLKDWLLELKQKQVNIFNVYLLYWLQLLVSDDRDTVLKCDHMK